MKESKKRKDDKEILKKRMVIRVTDEEFENLNIKAKKAGKDVSKLVRLMLKNRTVIITSKSDISTTIELKRIGVNINQIAKKVNQVQTDSSIISESKKLDSVLIELRETIKKFNV